MKKSLLSLVAAFAIALTPIAASAADPVEPVDAAVAYALDAVPGGVLLTAHSAEWPELGMRIDAASARTRSVATCATGSICAYSNPGTAGTKLSWTTCGSKSTAALATVGSIANARSAGTLSAFAGSTVRATAGAGAASDVPLAYRSSITTVSC